VYVEELKEGYDEFCRNNRLKKVEFRPDHIAIKFKIDLTYRPSMKLIMKKSSK